LLDLRTRARLGAPLSSLPRDRPETPFSRLLEALLEAHAEVVAAVFVDQEGECVDYAARVDPFEAQLLGAHLARATIDLLSVTTGDPGEPVWWRLRGAQRELLVRRVTPEHCLAVAASGPCASARLVRALPGLARRLLLEASLDPPPWEPPPGTPVIVETRAARGWPYAPAAYVERDGRRHPVEVIGRFEAPLEDGTGHLIGFRVRDQASELTLVHVPREDRWVKQ